MHTPITALYAALLALLFIVLALRVIRLRGTVRVPVGTGGDRLLERAVRVHGNCAEYAPIGIVLLLLVELCGYMSWVVHLNGTALLAGRVIHAWGMAQTREVIGFRVVGMVVTFAMLASCAALLVVATVWPG